MPMVYTSFTQKIRKVNMLNSVVIAVCTSLMKPCAWLDVRLMWV